MNREDGSGWHSRGRGHRPRRGGGRGRRDDDFRHNYSDGATRDEYQGSMSAGKAKYGQRQKRDRSGERGRGRGRPPPGLRGREIGLWYASRQKERNKETEKQNTPQITIDSHQERHLTNLLANIRSSEACPPQPCRSYADPFEDEEVDYNEKANREARNPRGFQDDYHRDGSNSERRSYSSFKNEQQSSASAYPSRNSSLFDNNVQDHRPYSSDDYSRSRSKSAYNARDSSLFDDNAPLKSEVGSSYGRTTVKNEPVSNLGVKTEPLSNDSNVAMKNEPVSHTMVKNEPTFSPYNRSQTNSNESYYSNAPRGNTRDSENTSWSRGNDFDDDITEWGRDSDIEDDDSDDESFRQRLEEMERQYYRGREMDEQDADAFEGQDLEEDNAAFDLGLYENEENQGDSEFLYEFLKHNAANRRSMENLNAEESTKAVHLQRQPDLDDRLLKKLKDKQNKPAYQEMMRFRKKLPSFAMKNDILDLIYKNQVVVISGETGCGKTTQVSQFILDDYIQRGEGSLCRVVCTQPRRISAISVAERVADERAESCGSHSVGYQIRLDSKLPTEQGSILYCTTGIMLKWLESDPLLSCTSHVILDEIHERDILSDFLMIILRDLLPRRPDLKLILMSATLNAEQFSQYYNGCPMINIPGFTYPVKEFLLEDVLQITGYRPDSGSYRKPSGRMSRDRRSEIQAYKEYCDKLRNRQIGDIMKTLDTESVDTELCAHLAVYIMKDKPPGAVLIFVPGWSDIKAVNDKIEQKLSKSSISKSSIRLIPLHSLMPTVNQREVFQRPPEGVRKVIIATNIAETSITIDDIVYVIDSGKIKMKNFDAENNIQTLMAEWVSHANAKQRRGRAGRVQAGECYHLYSRFHDSLLQDYQLPEMLRTRLEELCLQIKIMKLGRVEPFVQKAMQPPSMEALKQSLNVLRDLNALDQFEDLTPLGYHLAKMPVDPHSGKMLLYGAMFSCLDPIMTIAASLSFKDAFYVPLGKEKLADAKRRELADQSQSDHIMLINAYKGWERAKSRGTMWQYCRENFLSHNTLQMLSDMRRQFATLLHEMKFLERPDPKCPTANRNSGNVRLLKAIVCAGLFPNVAKIVKVKPPNKEWQASKLSTKTDRSVVFHPKSVNANETEFTSQWVVYHLKMKVKQICLFDSTVTSPLSLLFFGGVLRVIHKEMDPLEDPDVKFVDIGGHVTMKANQKTCHLVRNLRSEFDNLLEYKISHPGTTNWDNQSKEGALLRAIVELIESEREQPPIFNRRRPREKRDQWNRTCDQCGEKGHTARKCKMRQY